MTDSVSKKRRGEIMAAVRSKNTKPEMKVRSYLHRSGLRYGLHNKKLPGKPDLVLPKHRAIVFVHGCFWHSHQRCALARVPKSNVEFWTAKIQGNASRDVVHSQKLTALGWRVFIVWECEINEDKLNDLVVAIRSGDKPDRKNEFGN